MSAKSVAPPEPSSKVAVADDAPAATAPPATGAGWGRFLARTAFVSLRPRAFWTKLREGGAVPSTAELLWPHALILTLADGAAVAVGDIIHGHPADVVALHGALAFATAFLLVIVFALVARAVVAGRGGAGVNLHEAFAFSVYGLTPLLLLGILNVIPVKWLSMIIGFIALPYSFYVLAVGVVPFLRVPERRGAEGAGLLSAGLLLAWSLTTALAALPTL
ncbi:MAG: hypothetical protein CVU56_20860 [Deltaproteobacteria bacterium HGW-Deltaproteobacteria-14]|jgi:hypothetical protein|nr:MAG: hypothetical protein CVU56_20860 [Deltaproteobacteria bacterium HGW-Deltaproteobacteria-14]